MANLQRVVKTEIFPSNRSANNNIWSYRQGNPILNFTISGNEQKYLLSNTLRLNFTYRLRTAAGAFPNNDNQSGAGLVEIVNNDKIGAVSAIQSLTITNKFNQTLEQVRNYPRLLATMIPARANFGDYASVEQMRFGACSNVSAQGMLNNADFQVSMPILAGIFLMGDQIPMGDHGTGGMQLKIHLSPSIEANYGANAAGSYWEIVNPTLSFSFGIPLGGVLPKIKSYPYLSYSSFYNVINNSDETHNINCNLSSVISTFSNFVPTNWIANDQLDGNQTTSLLNNPGTTLPLPGNISIAPLSRYSVLRGGLLYPYQFQVNESRLINTNAAGVVVGTTPAQLLRNFLSASSSTIDDLDSTLLGNLSQNTPAAPSPPNDTLFNTRAEEVFGVGARQDQLGNASGANYKTRNYSHRFQSALNGISSNSVYTFFLHKNDSSS